MARSQRGERRRPFLDLGALGALGVLVTILSQGDQALATLAGWFPYLAPFLRPLLVGFVGVLALWLLFRVVTSWVQSRRTRRRTIEDQAREEASQREHRTLQDAQRLYEWCISDLLFHPPTALDDKRADVIFKSLVGKGLLPDPGGVKANRQDVVPHVAELIAMLETHGLESTRIILHRRRMNS